MQPRTEVALAGAAAAALLLVAFAGGRSQRGGDDPDPRPSSFLAGREGTRALADAAERLGVEVVRWRYRPQRLDSASALAFGTLAVIDPSRPVTPSERVHIVRWAAAPAGGGGNLLLAGRRASPLMRCFGYRVDASVLDSVRVRVPPGPGDGAWVHAHLAPLAGGDGASGDAGRDRARPGTRAGAREEARAAASDADAPCGPAVVLAVDTVLRTTRGDAAMLRLTVAPAGHAVLLAGDAALLRNRTLRSGPTGALVLDALLPRRGPLVFDEYHHGFGAGGSMARAVLDWSRRHPAGWLAWQLAVVGVLALLAFGVRLGPVRAALPRRRRSSAEHVQALASALAAARGHREAVAAMVRGLRRRLAPLAAPARHDDWRAWLDTLARQAAATPAHDGVARLQRLADSPQPETAVLDAACAVEDVWSALRP